MSLLRKPGAPPSVIPVIPDIGVSFAELERAVALQSAVQKMATINLSALDQALRALYPDKLEVVGPPPTWAGRCQLCRRLKLSQDDPAKLWFAWCSTPGDDVRTCYGAVVLLPEYEAVLAAYALGGQDALEPWR